jgi:PKD repeat protein
LAASLALSACDKVPLLAPTNTTIRLTTSVGVLPTNGSTDITAVVIESAGTPVQNGTVITFTSSLGTVEPREARTSNGQATARFIAGVQSGAAKLSAFSGGSKSEDVEILVGAAAAGAISVRASAVVVPTTGGTTDIIATVLDTGGNPLRGAAVRFSTTAGQLSQSTAISNDAGEARTQLTTDRQADVTADVGGGTSAPTAKVTIQARDVPTVKITAGTGNTGEVGLPTIFTLEPPPAASSNTIREVILNLGDGTVRNLGALLASSTVSHTYGRAGNYTVTATATDTQNFVATSSIAVTINERSTVPINLQLNSVSSGIATFTANLSGASPISGSIRVYDWDFGDGKSASTSGNQTSNRYSSPGNYLVRVRVLTTTGQEGFAELPVRIPVF